MLRVMLSVFEPFILSLMGVVVLASLLPPRGAFVAIFEWATVAGIVLLFFLHGAKLSREAIAAGMRNWRLHLAVLGFTYAMFPLLGLGISALPVIDPALAAGLLFLTLLPSTVQSSIAFTAIARGNVAAALCSASLSNLLGIVLTPALVALLMQSEAGGMGGGISWDAAQKILLELLAPFVAGHLLRPVIGAWVARHKRLVATVDRGSILLVVYSAFGAAVVAGLWQLVSALDLTILLAICIVLLTIILSASWWAGKAMGLPREDAVVLLFCGSKKSLASGVPIAGVLFPAASLGMILLPVMLFHQLQLIACAVIAQRLERQGANRADARAQAVQRG